MIQLLDKPTTQLRILHLEDDRSTQETFCKIAEKTLENVRVKCVQDSMKFYCQLPFENPHVIVVDWVLEDGSVDFILEELKKFKGLVIFFSGYSEDRIIKNIKNILGDIPKNFKVFSKDSRTSYFSMIQKIKAYSKSIEIHL